MFGPTASQPTYTGKYAFRGLISVDEVRDLLGDEKAVGRFIHMGADAHVLSCPVAGGRMVNVAAFVTDRNPWKGEDGKMIAGGTKAEAVEAFRRSDHLRAASYRYYRTSWKSGLYSTCMTIP